jgi:hypothetical protein
MKTKTWTVIANTGKQAALESGLEKKEVPKPTHINASEFVHWLAPGSHIDEDSLRTLFRRVPGRTQPSALVNFPTSHGALRLLRIVANLDLPRF